MVTEESADDGLEAVHPQIGHVYSIASRAYAVIQQRESHPAVVLAPIYGTDEWRVWIRTSQMNRPGFDHPANRALGLEKRGRFCKSDIHRVAGHVFRDPKLVTKHHGPLEPVMFRQLLDWWESP